MNCWRTTKLSASRLDGARTASGAARILLHSSVQITTFLEIGPYNRPLFHGQNVRYFDVLDRMGLAAIRKDPEMRDFDLIPEIDFVSPTGDLDTVPGIFDAVVSSHVIEHQPDLAGHLNKVSARLRPGDCISSAFPTSATATTTFTRRVHWGT